MPHINLLPWREELRAERQRQFLFAGVGAMIFMGLVIVLVHINASSMIDNQKARNAYLQKTIKGVEKQIQEIKTLKEDKAALLARMNVIQKLQRSRPEIVHLFEEISKATPKGVYLLNTSRKGKTLHIEGVADSNDSVSTFMRQLNDSPWLTSPRLDIIDSSKKAYPNSSWFKLKVHQAEIPTKAKQQKKETKS
jgi:type IV pilus assembly protein PilN